MHYLVTYVQEIIFSLHCIMLKAHNSFSVDSSRKSKLQKISTSNHVNNSSMCINFTHVANYDFNLIVEKWVRFNSKRYLQS